MGGYRLPPIQCEGFLCSVVFLTPKGGGVPGGNQGSYRGFPAPVPVYAVAPLGQLERGGAAQPTQGPASGIHGAWALVSLVCALQS